MVVENPSWRLGREHDQVSWGTSLNKVRIESGINVSITWGSREEVDWCQWVNVKGKLDYECDVIRQTRVKKQKVSVGIQKVWKIGLDGDEAQIQRGDTLEAERSAGWGLWCYTAGQQFNHSCLLLAHSVFCFFWRVKENILLYFFFPLLDLIYSLNDI